MNSARWTRLIAESDLGPTERLVCQTLAVWIDWQTLELWPSIPTIAEATNRTERTIQRVMRSLEARGIVRYVRRSTGGIGRSHRFRVCPDALKARPNGDTVSPLNGDMVSPITVTLRAANGDMVSPKQYKEQERQQQQQPQGEIPPPRSGPAAAVAALLGGEDLLAHPNATPDRLAWIARVAPGKRRPGAWAAEAIRRGYVPEADPDAAKHAAQAERERQRAAYARFEAMPEAERSSIVAAVQRRYPNLRPVWNREDSRSAIFGAVAAEVLRRELANAPLAIAGVAALPPRCVARHRGVPTGGSNSDAPRGFVGRLVAM